jgi:hypothetical protein
MTDSSEIDVVEVLDCGSSEDGSTGFLDLKTKDGRIVRLNFQHDTLAQLPYIVLPLSSEVQTKAMGPDYVHTYVIDELDVIEDVTVPDTLILRMFFGRDRKAGTVFEAPPSVVDQLADAIAALRQEGPYAGSSKRSH